MLNSSSWFQGFNLCKKRAKAGYCVLNLATEMLKIVHRGFTAKSVPKCVQNC